MNPKSRYWPKIENFDTQVNALLHSKHNFGNKIISKKKTNEGHTTKHQEVHMALRLIREFSLPMAI